MTQRFKMSDSFHPICNRFFIYNISRAKRYRHTKTFFDHICQYFKLYLPHQLCLNFLQLIMKQNMKLRFFFLQLTKLWQHNRRITALRQYNLIRQYRLQQRNHGIRFCAKPFTRLCLRQPCDCTYCPCMHFTHCFIFDPRVNPNLIDLFFPSIFLF